MYVVVCVLTAPATAMYESISRQLVAVLTLIAVFVLQN